MHKSLKLLFKDGLDEPALQGHHVELTLLFGELLINLQHGKDTRQISLNDFK